MTATQGIVRVFSQGSSVSDLRDAVAAAHPVHGSRTGYYWLAGHPDRQQDSGHVDPETFAAVRERWRTAMRQLHAANDQILGFRLGPDGMNVAVRISP